MPEPLTVDVNSPEGFGTFKESLGELGQDKSFEPIQDFSGLAKSYVEAQKLVGGSIRLPKPDLSTEDRATAVTEIVGKLRTEGILEAPPDSPEKYEFQLPTGDFVPNQPLVDSFRTMAHKSGYTTAQAQAGVDWYINFQAESKRVEDAAFQTMKDDMKTEFAGLYPRKMEAARRAVFKYMGEDGDKLMSKLPPDVGDKLVRAFAVIGEPLLEEAMVGGELPGLATVEKLQAEIDAMWADKDGKRSPLMDESHLGHKEAVKKHTELQQSLARLQVTK